MSAAKHLHVCFAAGVPLKNKGSDLKMTSDILQQARDYENSNSEKITREERPSFHVTPPIGWMNDPNGFSVYKGEYHLFFQYHPYSIKWGPMHWGHYKTKDFIRWERLPAAIAPDSDFDISGCFSGSAIELSDGRQLLMYTGVYPETLNDGTTKTVQAQCIALGDGINYEKLISNPVLTEKDLPEWGSKWDFRDPKIWKKDKELYAVIGTRTEDGSGAILLYKASEEAPEKWTFVSTVDRSNNEYGKMWECPDLFLLDGQWVLITSPQNMVAKGFDYHNGHDVICIAGEFDYKTGKLIREKVMPVDQGIDFYAPQTLLTADGRRVMIAWMQAWDSSKFVPKGQKWFGMFTIPRELNYRNGRLVQNPVREIENYRCGRVYYEKAEITGSRTLPGISGRSIDMTVTVLPGQSENYSKFTVHFAENEDFYSSISFSPSDGLLTLDRTYSGFPHYIVHSRTIAVNKQENNPLKLRILLDRNSVELFINDGEQAMSAVLYTPSDAGGISFKAEGRISIDVEKYDLKF